MKVNLSNFNFNLILSNLQQSRDDLHKEMEKIQKELTQAKNEQQKSATELIKVIIEGAMNKSDDDDDVPFEVEIENFKFRKIC